MAVLPDLTVQTDTKILKQHIVMVSERLASGAKLYKPAKRSKVSTSKTCFSYLSFFDVT